MEGKLLHIVGGGSNQVPLVLAAKKLGLKILVTDMYEYPPCRQYADFYEQIDTTDKGKTLVASQKYKIDAIISDQTDVAVPTVAYIAETMGLEGIGYETALKFTNKFLMRETLKNFIPRIIPSFEFFNDPKAALNYCKYLNINSKKFIIKPINSQGSKGVNILHKQKLEEQVNSSFKESKNRGILIEEFIDGFEYSVESYTQDGEIFNLAVTKKYHFAKNDCIDERNTYLGDVSTELENILFAANQLIIKKLGLKFGITHAEFKVYEGNAYLIEIAARGGGGSISSKIIPYLTAFNPVVALIHRLFKKHYEIYILDYKKRFVVMRFFNLKPGKVKSINFENDLIKNLLVFNLDIKPGDEIKEIKDSRDRPGYYVVAGENRLKVLDLEREIESSIHIEYE